MATEQQTREQARRERVAAMNKERAEAWASLRAVLGKGWQVEAHSDSYGYVTRVKDSIGIRIDLDYVGWSSHRLAFNLKDKRPGKSRKAFGGNIRYPVTGGKVGEAILVRLESIADWLVEEQAASNKRDKVRQALTKRTLAMRAKLGIIIRTGVIASGSIKVDGWTEFDILDNPARQTVDIEFEGLNPQDAEALVEFIASRGTAK